MNLFTMSGRVVGDVDIRYTNNQSAVAHFRFAVNRSFKREGEADADFFQCVAFGRIAENMEKLHIGKGTKLLLSGEFRNNDYTDREGVKHYGYNAVVSFFEFCESKSTSQRPQEDEDGFVTIPDGIEEEGLPFN